MLAATTKLMQLLSLPLAQMLPLTLAGALRGRTPPQPAWPWSWETVQTWCMPGFTTDMDDAPPLPPAPPWPVCLPPDCACPKCPKEPRPAPPYTGSPGRNESAGQLNASEALYYSNFSIFATQTWDVSCMGGSASCEGFNSCKCQDARTGAAPQGRWRPDQEARGMVAGAATKAHNPRQRYLPYVYFSVSQTHYAGQVNFSNAENAALWLRDGAGRPLNGTPAGWGGAPGSNTTSTHTGPIIADQGLGMEARLYDFGNPATRRYFIDIVMAPFLEAEVCDGAIFDEVTWLMHPWSTQYYVQSSTLGSAASQQRYAQGVLTMVGELSDAMIAKSKYPFYSTATHLGFYPEVYRNFTSVLQKHGGGRLWEFWCLNDPVLEHMPDVGGLNSTCLNTLLTLQHEARLGIPAVVHAVWDSPKWAPKAQGLDSLEFSLAAFLVAAGEYQYFVYGPANSWRLRNDAGRDFLLFEEYKKRLGAPRGLAVRDGGHSDGVGGTQFTRKFEHAQVWCDVATRKANITWLS